MVAVDIDSLLRLRLYYFALTGVASGYHYLG
jgi:hypothetical protein